MPPVCCLCGWALTCAAGSGCNHLSVVSSRCYCFVRGEVRSLAKERWWRSVASSTGSDAALRTRRSSTVCTRCRNSTFWTGDQAQKKACVEAGVQSLAVAPSLLCVWVCRHVPPLFVAAWHGSGEALAAVLSRQQEAGATRCVCCRVPLVCNNLSP